MTWLCFFFVTLSVLSETLGEADNFTKPKSSNFQDGWNHEAEPQISLPKFSIWWWLAIVVVIVPFTVCFCCCAYWCCCKSAFDGDKSCCVTCAPPCTNLLACRRNEAQNRTNQAYNTSEDHQDDGGSCSWK